MIATKYLSLAFAFLLSAAADPAQSPNLSPAQLLPGDAAVGPAVGDQRNPAMATGAGVTLLVWNDTRSGDREIYGVRLDPAGQPIEPVSFPIAHLPGDQSDPRVAWNGTSFLVVWQSQEPTQFYYETRLRAARVSPQGVVLDPTPLALPGEAVSFTLTSDAGAWLVVRHGPGPASSADLVGYRVSAQGQLLTPGGVLLVAGGTSLKFNLGLAAAGQQYLLVWSDYRSGTGWDVVGQRFDPQLQPIDPSPVALVATPRYDDQPFLAASPTEFFLIYWDRHTYWSQGVLGVRFDLGLQPVQTAPITLAPRTLAGYQPAPCVAWDGAQWIAAWRGAPAVRAARISATGDVLDPGGIALNNAPALQNQYEPTLAVLPAGGAQVAWSDIRFGGASLYSLFGAGFTAGGQPTAETLLSRAAPQQDEPQVTPGNGMHLLTFRSVTADTGRILATRLDAAGNALDPEPLVVATGGPQYGRCTAAWNGAVFLVCWNDANAATPSVLARRMRPDGSFVDPAPFQVMPGNSPDVDAIGDVFLVTAAHAPSSPHFRFPYARRVRGSTGELLDPAPLWLGQYFSVRPRVAVVGNRFTVVSERHASHDNNSTTIEVVDVTPAGAVGAPTRVAGALIQTWGTTDIASSGSTALVTFANGSNYTNVDVYGRVLLASGGFASGTVNLTAGLPSGHEDAQTGWDGVQYVVAFETLHNNPLFFDREPDVYGVRVDEAGTVLDPNGFALWDGPLWDVDPAVRGTGAGRALFAASSYRDDAWGAFRIETRGLRPDGLASYGVGTPGCSGPHRLDASGTPRVNTPSFELVADNAPPSAPGLVLVSDQQDLAGSDPLGWGVLFHIGLSPTELIPVALASDPQGVARGALPIPNLLGLVNTVHYAQAFFGWNGPCAPSRFGVSSSEGLVVTIQ